jgi:protein required for attachment to host cells
MPARPRGGSLSAGHLQERVVIMPKRKTSWILVADGSRARILANQGPGSGLALVSEHEAPEARARSGELGTDRPGRAADSVHAMEPPVDWQRQEKDRFVTRMAELLATGRDNFDQLVLVAPARVMGALRVELDDQTKAKVTAELQKDLTWVTLPELAPHLGDVVKL